MLYPAELRALTFVAHIIYPAMTQHSTNLNSSAENNNKWTVYILISGDKGRTYVGVCLDMSKRLAQHNGEIVGGAKSTRAGRPWQVYRKIEGIGSRSEAQTLEAQIKSLRRQERLDFSYTT
jgi:predicted GIY-YIG superfamily endonuclease